MNADELHIPKAHVHKLLCAKNPDAALLYLYITGGNSAGQAAQALQMSQSRVSCASATLRQLGFGPKNAAALFSPESGPNTLSGMC